MKKKIAVILAVLCLMALFEPTVSHAEVKPGFISVDDVLIPFTDENMPFIIGGRVWVPAKVFESLNIWSQGSEEEERVVLYGGNRYIDFSTRPGASSTKDHNNEVLNWPPARRVGRVFYVPVEQVCEFFGLSVDLREISSDIIQQQQMWIVMIMSGNITNRQSFIQNFMYQNRNALRIAYNAYYSPPTPPSPPVSPGVTEPPPEEEEPTDFSGVSIYLSFYDTSAGNAEWIMDVLDIQAEFGNHSCFFVTADDILDNPGLIRRISGAGHTIGIRLLTGTINEYDRTSALLFEAAKIRTVLVSVAEDVLVEKTTDDLPGLINWTDSQDSVLVDERAWSDILSDITDMIPRETGERYSIMLPCSEKTALLLPGVISFLMEYKFALEKITETSVPIAQSR